MDGKNRRDAFKDEIIAWKDLAENEDISHVGRLKLRNGNVGFNMLSIKSGNDYEEFFLATLQFAFFERLRIKKGKKKR
jgi:hypothetical protein